VICEIMKDDGAMARMQDLERYARRHQLQILRIADLIAYRRNERQVRRRVETTLPTSKAGAFRLLVYMFDEGRGIGLLNKIRAYALQDRGRDTVEANHALGFAADMRDYKAAAHILSDLGVRRVRLLTNNPDKVRQLEEYGLAVAERMPIEIPPGKSNRDYLRTKRTKFGHLLSLDPEQQGSRPAPGKKR